ncbi:MAG: molybdopterin-binding protein, partial [Candidatus Delongbacteria bacterium]
MTAEFTNCNIINIGDEILSGHTVNTNASFISSALYDIGLYTRRISVISDDAGEIVSELEKGMKDAELIFITGGLGPTSDDITKRTLCSFFGFDLEFRHDIWEHILELFAKRGIIPDEVNKEQAQFPVSGKVRYLINT